MRVSSDAGAVNQRRVDAHVSMSEKACCGRSQVEHATIKVIDAI
jgi:hypothetical protein